MISVKEENVVTVSFQERKYGASVSIKIASKNRDVVERYTDYLYSLISISQMSSSDAAAALRRIADRADYKHKIYNGGPRK